MRKYENMNIRGKFTHTVLLLRVSGFTFQSDDLHFEEGKILVCRFVEFAQLSAEDL